LARGIRSWRECTHIIDGSRGGSIILISSLAGVKMQSFMVHYTASKHGVTGLARAFGAELGVHNIRVNSIHPGPVNTPMGSGGTITKLGAAFQTNDRLQPMNSPFLPQWAAEPEDIADTVCWLASDQSKFITAAALNADQGMAQF
jgi:NAD(P)-dependent dehydrogenase (short-subunit alcohol dehydrogenase family)